MAIDDPVAAFEKNYLDEKKSPLDLVLFGAKIALPKAGLPLEIFQKVRDRFTKASVDERLATMWHLLVNEIKNLETTKVDADDMSSAVQLMMRRDAEEFNDKKRERYVKLFSNAMRSETQIQDVTSFVQTLEQLNERDVKVLKVLNKVMNKEGDWKPQPNPGIGDVMKLHPSTLIGRAQELAVQVALALDQRIETNTFTREEGYGICNRLLGFGLAHDMMDAKSRELPLTNSSFRLSTSGVRLLRLLGEDVPNFDHYFRA